MPKHCKELLGAFVGLPFVYWGGRSVDVPTLDIHDTVPDTMLNLVPIVQAAQVCENSKRAAQYILGES